VLSGALGVAILAAAVLDFRPTWVVAGAVGALMVAATHRWFTRWPMLMSSVAVCILVVPIARYALPINLPFAAEPYQVLLAVIGLVWLASLLAQPDALAWRPSGITAPFIALIVVMAGSIGLNLDTIHARGIDMDIVFRVVFFAGFFLTMFMIGNVLRRRDDLDTFIKAVVGACAIVAFFTLVENKTGFNIFNYVHRVFPLLQFQPSGVPGFLEARGSGFRVYGSAQHPLALGAALVTVLPLGIYLGMRTHRKLWWAATALIGIAALATVARTAVMMLVVEMVILLCLKPRELKRYWWVVPPFLVAVNILVPSTLGTLKASFFPQGGLIAQQSTTPGGDASNRIADLGPSLAEAGKTPFFGQGWGSRVPEHLPETASNRFLDNQWLGIVLELGWFGVLAWIWFFGRNVRLLAGAALRDDSAHGWLLAGCAASIFGVAVGMFTYDAFGFSQASLLLFIVVGVGIAARHLGPIPDDEPRPGPRLVSDRPTQARRRAAPPRGAGARAASR